jgi:hypothetical protein
MNFDDIEKVWSSPRNHVSAGQIEAAKQQLLADLRRRRRGSVIFMLCILTVLAWITGKVVLQILRPDPNMDAIDLTREWAVVPLFALPWVCLWIFWRKYRLHRFRHRDCERSISAGIRALLDENKLALDRQKWAARLNGVMLVLVPVIVWQLRAAGKAGDEILVPAFVLLPAIMVCVYAAMLWHRRHRLLPRKRELEALLGSYGDGSS